MKDELKYKFTVKNVIINNLYLNLWKSMAMKGGGAPPLWIHLGPRTTGIRPWILSCKSYLAFHVSDIRLVVNETKYENMSTILQTNVLFCYPLEPFKEGMPNDYVPPPQIDNMTAVKEMIRLGRVLPLVNLLGEQLMSWHYGIQKIMNDELES